MATNEKDEVYLFERTELERQRLNQQHKLLVHLCHGHLLHPKIPQAQIRNVADVGTGTGIWLQDVSSTLAVDPVDPPVMSIGFDISDAHFPAEKRHNMSFITHDILKPFPERYHTKFDLVHVRLMVLALKKDQISTAAGNVAALLKPGGYFQWEEIETANLSFTPTTPAITSVRSAMRANSIANGLSTTPSIDITTAFEALSFTDIVVEDYNSTGRDEFTLPAREWTKAGAKAGLYHALTRSGQVSGEEGRDMANKLLAEYVRDIDGGVVPTLPLVMVVGKKSERRL